jgi:biotin transport system substrate-specific component
MDYNFLSVKLLRGKNPMTALTAANPTLAGKLLGTEGRLDVARALMLAIAGSLLLWASARIAVPFWPVPLTMQTFVVPGLGAAFGWRLGMATVALYLLEGAMGLPVFAGTPEKGIGLAYMAGPTGGYLAGFVLAAGITGWLAERGFDRNALTMTLAMLVGTATIYLLGVGYLASLIGMEKALTFGLYPFIPGDIAKVILAAIAFPAVWKWLNAKG